MEEPMIHLIQFPATHGRLLDDYGPLREADAIAAVLFNTFGRGVVQVIRHCGICDLGKIVAVSVLFDICSETVLGGQIARLCFRRLERL